MSGITSVRTSALRVFTTQVGISTHSLTGSRRVESLYHAEHQTYNCTCNRLYSKQKQVALSALFAPEMAGSGRSIGGSGQKLRGSCCSSGASCCRKAAFCLGIVGFGVKTGGIVVTFGLCEGADSYFRHVSCRNVINVASFCLEEEYMKVRKMLFIRQLCFV